MIRFVLYLVLLGSVLYLLSRWGQRQGIGGASLPSPVDGNSTRPSRWFRAKRNPREIWVQVYETASVDEARTLQARLQEEEIECVVYEKGKKDIHGNALTGLGIAVPKSQTPQAQTLISRMLG